MLTASDIKRLLDIANAGCHAGHVGQARIVYEGVLTLKPGFIPARIGQAYSHLVVDEFDEAEAILNDILAAHPADADAQVMLGLVCTLAGRSVEARAVLQPLTTEHGSRAELAATLLKNA